MNKKTLFSFLTLGLMMGCTPALRPMSSMKRGSADNSIVGGAPVTGEHFESAGVVMLLDTDTGNLCSATLIAKKTLLTAAHCIPKDEKSLDVFFDSSPLDENSQATVYQVHSVHIHPSYLFSADKNSVDLAMVILEEKAPSFLNLVQILEGNEVVKNAKVELYGFGKSAGDDDSTAGVLRSVTVQIAEVTKGFFEVDQSLGKGICDGDSGGPAMMTSLNGLALVGVSKMESDKNGEGKKTCSGVGQFTRVEPHIEWIRGLLQE